MLYIPITRQSLEEFFVFYILRKETRLLYTVLWLIGIYISSHQLIQFRVIWVTSGAASEYLILSPQH
jgi:hypothetical protein